MAPTPAPTGVEPSVASPSAISEPLWPTRGGALVIAALACVTAILSIGCLAARLSDAQIFDLVYAHGPAIVGIPAAALLSLTVVALARGVAGVPSIQIAGLRAEGATATLLLWLALFLACVIAIRALW